MAKPSEKSEGIEQFLTNLIGTDRRSAITSNICTSCKKPAEDFRDPLSEKEYTISGFCQTCQDEVFGR